MDMITDSKEIIRIADEKAKNYFTEEQKKALPAEVITLCMNCYSMGYLEAFKDIIKICGEEK